MLKIKGLAITSVEKRLPLPGQLLRVPCAAAGQSVCVPAEHMRQVAPVVLFRCRFGTRLASKNRTGDTEPLSGW